MDVFNRFLTDLHESRRMLGEQIDAIERGFQIRMLGETPEVSTVRFLATLQKHKADLDDLIPNARRCGRTVFAEYLKALRRALADHLRIKGYPSATGGSS